MHKVMYVYTNSIQAYFVAFFYLYKTAESKVKHHDKAID